MTQYARGAAAVGWGWAAMAALVLATTGCGGPSGPPRYDVRGSVTFSGKPVPAGSIVFEPDPEQGNTGPACYASITAGHYATPHGEGTVGGPHIVRITGTDGIAQGEFPEGRTLFTEYRTAVDLPKDSSTQDFAISKTAKRPGRP